MKKLFLFVALISWGLVSFAQTEQIEIDNLSHRYKAGEFSLKEYQNMANDWKDLIKFFGGFPVLPFNNQTGQVEFKKILTFDNLPKKVIYDRIMEWAALRFGSLPAVFNYSNEDDGRIILKGYFEVFYKGDTYMLLGNKKETIRSIKCFHTYNFFVKDNKMKIEIMSIIYKYFLAAFSLNDPDISFYYPSSDLELPITNYYPITNADPIEWKGRLDLLKQTDEKINALVGDLSNYINNKAADYDF